MELSYFYSQYLPATWAIWNGSRSIPLAGDPIDGLPSDQDILDALADLVVMSMYCMGRNSQTLGFTGQVISESLRVVDNPTTMSLVGSFLKKQGILVGDTLDEIQQKLKDWYSNIFNPSITQSVSEGVAKADPQGTTVPIVFDNAVNGAIKGFTELLAKNAITSTVQVNSSDIGTRLTWNTKNELSEKLTQVYANRGIITSGTKFIHQSLPNNVITPDTMVQAFVIRNAINGKVIPASTIISPLNNQAIKFNTFSLAIRLIGRAFYFTINGTVNSASLNQNCTIEQISRQAGSHTGGTLTWKDYVNPPYTTLVEDTGSSRIEVELFNDINESYNVIPTEAIEPVWSEIYDTQLSGFFDGMTAEQIESADSYILQRFVQNNVISGDQDSFPVVIDPNAVPKLINETFDIVTSGNATGVSDRADEGRTAVLNPDSVTDLTGTDVVAGDLVDTIPQAINVYPVDTATDTTIGTISIPIADAVQAIDQANEDSGASEGVVTNPLVSDTGDYGMFTLYKMTHTQLKALSSKLWSADFVSNFHPFKNDPSEALISLMAYPINIEASGTTSNVICGNLNCAPASGNIITKLFQTKSLGSIKIPERFGNYLDYSPYTKISMFLPFIGIVQLDPDEVVGATLKLDYRVELLTGTCVATVTVIKGTMNAILYQYNGNMGITLPMSASSFGRVYSNLIGGALALGAGVATGGVGALVMAGLSAGNTAMNSKPSVSKSGGMGGNSGMCGNMSAYVIIDYAVPDTPDGYNNLKGRPSNKYLRVGSLNGFVKLDRYYLDIPDITDDERVELDSILKDGFII